MWRHIPNALTVARMLFTPWIGFEIARHGWRAAFWMMLGVGLTDWFDGYLARRFGWQTTLGAKLDPAADKLMVGTVFLALGVGGVLPWWVVGLVFGRDILIVLFAIYGARRYGLREFAPSIWGKVSTALQMLLGGGCMLRGVWPEHFLAGWVPGVMWASVAATVWSGAHYGWTGYGMVKKKVAGGAD